jgi:hypothetical protein
MLYLRLAIKRLNMNVIKINGEKYNNITPENFEASHNDHEPHLLQLALVPIEEVENGFCLLCETTVRVIF